MSKVKAYTLKEFRRLMRNNGYKEVSCKGSHFKFEKDGCESIVMNKDPNRMVVRRLVKEHGLIE